MVIDDDNISLSVISHLLKSDGHEVLQAADGPAALNLLGSMQQEELPSVLLADLRMPGLSGQDLAVALRRAAPEATLLAMSATPSAAEGYDAFLKKPLDPAALHALLDGQPGPRVTQAVTSDLRPVLDDEVYQKMTRMMPASAVREVYEACLSDVRARAPEMREAAAANDVASVRRIAHTFKGSAGMIGAKQLGSAAAELELGVYQPENVPKLVDNLLSCCDELHRILLNKLQL